jgi:hypothetical protein
LVYIQNVIIEKNEKGKLKIEPINEEEIERVIKNLKPGKSPDIDGISAEHYKNAMDELKHQGLIVIIHRYLCWILL